ncbi:hypothetical protein BGZ60DRAFT_407646 [Tricladium varicosporioides]|nr:hypothetical protein BGZ60DRAFT_407646 [Hymenoscyphus varicosporioides]
MEGLIHCARNSFKDQFVGFEDEPLSLLRPGSATSENGSKSETLFETIEIRHGIVGRQFPDSPEHSVFHNRSQQPASELAGFYEEQYFGKIAPQLKLIRIHSRFLAGREGSTGSFSLSITRSLFNRLLDQMQANPWVLWLISSKYDGFHHIKGKKKGHADTYFFGFFHSAIVWTFLPETACTKALLISRLSSQHESFYALLNSYTSHLFTPYVPLLAITLTTMCSSDEILDRYANDIINVEKGTGFSWVSRDISVLSFNVDALARWSRASANAQINIINLLRHHESCICALDTIQAKHTGGNLASSNAEYKEDYDRSITEILDSIHVLKMRADSFIPYATYLKNRAEAQISVIFALLTHEDSVSNLKAAEASMEIAAAAKRDSSAMKTIAVLTMVFLPATFLATIFALPVLEWEYKRDVQMDGFQLYWTVAIPSTAAVFFVWAMVTQRSWISNKILKHRRRVDGLGKKDC